MIYKAYWSIKGFLKFTFYSIKMYFSGVKISLNPKGYLNCNINQIFFFEGLDKSQKYVEELEALNQKYAVKQ